MDKLLTWADPEPRKLYDSGAGRQWRMCLHQRNLFLGTVFKFRHKAVDTSLEPDHPQAFFCLSDALLGFDLLCLQNSPAAAAEASDFGDGQGFSHLQAGWHTDWHLPHGEFPEGTTPLLPRPTPQSPVSPQLATSKCWGVRETTQLTPRLSLHYDVTVMDCVPSAGLMEGSCLYGPPRCCRCKGLLCGSRN